LTPKELFADVSRRVFRFDKAFATTLLGMLRKPGRIVVAHLEGRRAGLLDPLQFFISSVFVQFVIGGLTRLVAPLVGRESALGWLERVGGVVALKIFVIFLMASIWGLLFRRMRYNMAEIYVFATYAFATTGILWTLVPLLDLLIPVPLGASRLVVAIVTLSIEIIYMTYAIAQFTPMPAWQSFARISIVLAIGYGGLVGLFGVERTIALFATPLARG
jgi:hypothetical protein